ncbi:hypothetical protein CMU84_16185 [Elizabethkingia anophelis]|nr:hypothetical protein [Elizabethkingia anophelis]
MAVLTKQCLKIMIGNMSEEEAKKDYPVVRRFILATYYIIATEGYRGKKTLCDETGIHRGSLNQLEKDNFRKLPTEWLTIFVEKYKISAHWLLTGKGKIKEGVYLSPERIKALLNETE